MGSDNEDNDDLTRIEDLGEYIHEEEDDEVESGELPSSPEFLGDDFADQATNPDIDISGLDVRCILPREPRKLRSSL